MNIHEFQAKALLSQYGIPTLDSRLACSSQSAFKAAQELGGDLWVLKAQVHAGGRGKGGGIKIAKSLEEVKNLSDQMIGMNLITPQTGSSGEKVHQILIEKAAEIDREFYLALLVNRETSTVSIIVSDQGGVDIEETARTSPEKIVRVHIHPVTGVCSFQKRACAEILALNKKGAEKLFKIISSLYSLFIKEDLALLEINPFVWTNDEKLYALDAKISLDSNARYRHPHWSEYILEEELKTPSVQAQLQGFSFVPLDGYIGCMVNGAGLAMATMDMIQLFGGEPANFLDVGGDTDVKRIQTAFQFILKDPKVRGILINIFGGIVRCDLIAKGIIQAVSRLDMKVPLVVRLEGNSADEAKTLLQQTKLNITSAGSLTEAAEQIISLTA